MPGSRQARCPAPVKLDAWARSRGESCAAWQVLAELYSSTEISIKPHNVVALVLHKVVDPVSLKP